MPIVTPLPGPPAPTSHRESTSEQPSSKTTGIVKRAVESACITSDSKPGSGATQSYKIPVVRLDEDPITDAVAARLATSLLGHVLFLKSQVPFPVTQLSRIPGTKSSARAIKQRNDLLASFDTLSSHLNTTFTSLSTALARCSTRKDLHNLSNNNGLTRTRERAYLAILVGPSTGSARSKIVYAIDGLETKIWGMADNSANSKVNEDESEEDESEEDESGEDESEGEHAECDSDNSNCSDPEGSSDSGGEEPEDSDSSNDEQSPPPSRSPSPPPNSHPTYAEQQQTLRTADRLLSRTLATSDAEGISMATEMSPTQTHVLIRAPRRFDHPAWIPRQNISASMNTTLDDFLVESGLKQPPESKKRRGQSGKAVEGVWITCRDGIDHNLHEDDTHGGDEGDEMIWWSWDGKIVGFSEW